ncbi:hypothetical protein AVEN_194526-1 [Araneus ventricosus]|uniref:Uncharacterized protein n=1 Tax=Araneus ventricosus TaxID=182803 RepID=A0A4Y2A7B8_ARAVE|nr:hypothetical protein AVEN_194526-1 [Araneus ventricosus]
MDRNNLGALYLVNVCNHSFPIEAEEEMPPSLCASKHSLPHRRNGSLTVQRYRDDILRLFAVYYAAAIWVNSFFMENNARLHSPHLVDDFL